MHLCERRGMTGEGGKGVRKMWLSAIERAEQRHLDVFVCVCVFVCSCAHG